MEQTLLTLVSIMTAIMLAAIPWAYVIHGRLTQAYITSSDTWSSWSVSICSEFMPC